MVCKTAAPEHEACFPERGENGVRSSGDEPRLVIADACTHLALGLSFEATFGKKHLLHWWRAKCVPEVYLTDLGFLLNDARV